MGWEYRGKRLYYYRKRREGKRVLSEYTGGGLHGWVAELFDVEEREEIEYKRAELQKQKTSAQALDRQVNEVEKYTLAITRASLLMAGYHTHKRQWRKLRNV